MKSFNKSVTWLLFILVESLTLQFCEAQKNDYIWLTGSASAYRTSATDSIAGNVKLDFNYNPLQISFDSISLNFWRTDVTFSDTAGNLLFYTNGIAIHNQFDQLMENGDSINAGYIIDVYDTQVLSDGLDLNQSMLGLPSPARNNQYYLLQSYDDTVPGLGSLGYNYSTAILNTLVDMNANNYAGQVIYKNQPILTDTGGLNESTTAVKHGNGRDWWFVVHSTNRQCFYTLLLDTSGFHIIDSIFTGPKYPQFYFADYSCFSPDGSKFVFISDYGGPLGIFDFDRCNGKLSNPRLFPMPDLGDSGDASGLSISPNSRFLYLSFGVFLYQFDLQSDSIFNHIDTVGIWDGSYWVSPALPIIFCESQLAPDGKIYIYTCNNFPYYHVINNPDDSGAACNLVQRGAHLTGQADGIPNFPNYRLGPLNQSQCDSLSGLNEVQRAAKEQILKIYPNPATDYTIVDYGFADWSKGAVQLQICNALGQTMPIGRQAVYTQQLPMYSGFQKIDVSNFASGMYTIFIKRNNAIVASGKVVKE